MLRRPIVLIATLALLASSSALGTIWPEEFFGYKRTSVRELSLASDPVWEEYGFDEGEAAQYELNGVKFTATGYRLGDSTSAMAVYQWKCPQNETPSDLADLAVEWNNSVFLAFGNYVLRFEGRKPTSEELVGLYLVLPLLERAPLPSFPEFIPAQGQIAGSRRFVVGPASLEKFEPRVSPSVAGFHFGVEAQLVKFKFPKADLELGVFSYPTPDIARERLPEFRMIPGAMVKRTGSLVAVVFDPPDANAAEKLLAKVNYRATITWDALPGYGELTIAEVVLTTFLFIGGLVVTAFFLGVLFGGIRFLKLQGLARMDDEDPMILLHIEDK